MSKVLINQYYTNLDRAVQFGKSKNEQAIRNHFWNLLNDYARKYHYETVTEVLCMGTKGVKVRPDGIVKNAFGLDIGLWESKDEKDDIDDEIFVKLKKGYPFTNILFEDSQTAVLFQRGNEVRRASVRDADQLHAVLTQFMTFKSDIIYIFEDALEKFKEDIPVIVETLRNRIDDMRKINKKYVAASQTFLELCKTEINPDITAADVREMIIQHILTGDIFNKIFDDPEFHKHNNIARELETLIDILFTYSERKNLLGSIGHYYDAINSAAANIADHHEKQKFLKVLYENFYKVYNPKAADRLGVVYTPNEIVQFMIESADYLLHKHFQKTLADQNVEILDPATGTGTFITAMIDYIPKQHLEYKYRHEIHANEIAILPYYIANLNIEFTYKQKMECYEEFKNLCFVDTLDNTGALSYSGKQHSLFGLSSENTERIQRQNTKKISVIIGNPPYNAKQALYNDQNKNRLYKEIDQRIRETYIKHGTAQNQIVVYDMYTRFYRWASDRLDKNGVLAFISNRSFIDSRTFDGFRKCIQEDFHACYIIDTKSDVRANPKIAGTTHNVFGIQTGVAIMFLVKKEKHEGKCKIEYAAMEEVWRKEIKLEWLRNNKFENISFDRIRPDKKNNWINLTDNDFDDLLPLIDKNVKAGKKEKAVFQLFSSGIKSQRDEWVYDFSKENLQRKLQYFTDIYQKTLLNKKLESKLKIKWDRELDKYRERKIQKQFEAKKIIPCVYRPFTKMNFYFDRHFNGMVYQWEEILNSENRYISLVAIGATKAFHCIAAKDIIDLHFTGDSQCLPLYRYTASGDRLDNITDWGLDQFVRRYKDKKIRKEDIFHYTYAVLHNPAYRKKYELNLKREFPRIPFYDDFRKWAEWGRRLTDLHIRYETAKPYDLKRVDVEPAESESEYPAPLMMSKLKVKLKADKAKGVIELDEKTSLHGIPGEAWEYMLGNRSAPEWVLDQYKEKKPKDPTIAEKFNTYRFADYKEHVIDLLRRVCTVSVETVKITEDMNKEWTAGT